MGRHDDGARRSRLGRGTRAFVATAAALTATMAAPLARAAPEAAATLGLPDGPRNKLALVLGLASPWGELGLSYQRQVAPQFALEMGVGLGATGAQVAALPKLLLGSGAARFYLEAGPSLTLGGNDVAGLWAAGEIGFESTFGSWTLGFGAGAGVLVAGSVPSPLCIDACSTMKAGAWLPEIRLVIGRNF